ncbi:MAG: aquaporin, partial [Gemmatimonadales bacterium]|nr:aquaporin [Gemmatimonadales bacterium]
MPSLSRRLVAEFIGTFMLVFFGCGSVVMQSYPAAAWELVGVALVHAVALGVAITTFFRFSTHFNPAVTIA